MSAKHALLGLLRQRPAYAYELADRLRTQLGPAWHLNSGQVSQTMRLIERDGLIAEVDASSEGSGRRRVMAITDSGMEDFERWFVEETVGASLSRRPLLVKIALAGRERLKDVLVHIDAYEHGCAEKLRDLSKAREDVPRDAVRVRADHVLLRLGLSADINQLQAELEWARHAREVIRWLEDQDALWPSGQTRPESVPAESPDRREAREHLFARMATRHLEPVPHKERDR